MFVVGHDVLVEEFFEEVLDFFGFEVDFGTVVVFDEFFFEFDSFEEGLVELFDSIVFVQFVVVGSDVVDDIFGAVEFMVAFDLFEVFELFCSGLFD